MAKLTWNLDQLKSQLNREKSVKAWAITQEHAHRRERYFMLDGKALVVDQDREVKSQNIYAKIIVNLDQAGRQGEITKKFFPSMSLKEQISAAIAAATQTDHQAWEMPKEIPTQLPELKTTDPRMAEDLESVTSQLTDRIASSVAKKRATQFSSAELFLSVHNFELHLSNGLTQRSSQSRIYTEAAYSMSRKLASGKTESDEYLNTQWAVNLDDLPVEKLFDETSDRAEHSLDVMKPRTGKYPVIVDSEVLATLFNGHLSQLSAGNAYHGLPHVKTGEFLIPDTEGDAISLILDPSLEYGADTAAISAQGVLQSPLKLVEENRVIATSTDKQFADYLKTKPTTVRGNIVLGPGKLTHQELTKKAPQVIEILQFSGLFADPNSGTFSSEIRLARLYDNVRGQVSYLKGGSLSGSITENFRNVRFSNQRIKRSHFTSGSMQGHGYYGPEYALLSDVSIVG